MQKLFLECRFRLSASLVCKIIIIITIIIMIIIIIIRLHKGVVESFKEVSKNDEDYPERFSERKTSLIPKEGEFLSENQRPITCLNNTYKWLHLASWHQWTNTLNIMA